MRKSCDKMIWYTANQARWISGQILVGLSSRSDLLLSWHKWPLWAGQIKSQTLCKRHSHVLMYQQLVRSKLLEDFCELEQWERCLGHVGISCRLQVSGHGNQRQPIIQQPHTEHNHFSKSVTWCSSGETSEHKTQHLRREMGQMAYKTLVPLLVEYYNCMEPLHWSKYWQIWNDPT